MTAEPTPPPPSAPPADPAPLAPSVGADPAYTRPPVHASRRLVRRSHDRMLGGVCAGVADYLRVDVTVVRLLTVLGAVLGFGSLVVVYLILWVALPQE